VLKEGVIILSHRYKMLSSRF